MQWNCRPGEISATISVNCLLSLCKTLLTFRFYTSFSSLSTIFSSFQFRMWLVWVIHKFVVLGFWMFGVTLGVMSLDWLFLLPLCAHLCGSRTSCCSYVYSWWTYCYKQEWDSWAIKPGLTHLSLDCSPGPSVVLCMLTIS